MAAKKTVAKKVETEDWFENSVNIVSLCGKVKRVLYDGEKVSKFTLETVNKTPKGNWSHSFNTITLFSEEVGVEEGDIVNIEDGYITTESFGEGKNKKYTTTVICNTLEVLN